MKLHLKPIHDQVIVLIGATSGIGLETAKHLAEKGARVVIVGRSQEGLGDALERVRTHAENHRMLRFGSMDSMGASSYYPQPGSFASTATMDRPEMGSQPLGETSTGGITGMTGTPGMTDMPRSDAPVSVMDEQVITLEGDITNFEDMRSVAEQVIQRFGRIDTWVNVAAVGEWALFEDTSADEFRRIIDVNLIGHANAAMAALPYLRQQRGSALIFVSSLAGRVPVPYQAAYAASKHGLNGMIDTLRMELKHTGAPVSVTNIMPTSVNTPLFDKARTKLGVEPDPLPPVYDTTLVARAIAHAAANPVRELIVGDAGIAMNFLKRLSPGLAQTYMSKMGFRQQRSDDPKSAQAPDNLYEHLGGYNRVQGDYTEMRVAPMTWLSTHPKARLAIFGGILAVIGAIFGWKMIQRRRSWRYRLPRQMRKFAKQTGKSMQKASKSAGKALTSTGRSISHMPVVSDLPMFHRKSLLERAGDTLAGFWAGALAILPFTRRKKITRRIADRISDVHIPEIHAPWNRQKSFAERITLADQRKLAGKKLDKTTHKVRDEIEDRRKQAIKMVDKAASRSKKMISKTPIVERRETLIDKVTFHK